MKKIHIYENALCFLIKEGRNAEKANRKTIEIFKDALNIDERKASEIEYDFRNWLFHANMHDSIIRLEPIMAHVALTLGYRQASADEKYLGRLQSIMNYIIENYRNNDFPIALNKLTIDNTTFEKLDSIFGNAVDAAKDEDEKAASKYSDNSKMNKDFIIKRVDSYEEAQYYGKYSCSKSPLCYATDEKTWNTYTNHGSNAAYVILHKNWKNIPEKHGFNTPYDDYGWSMVFLFINPYGEINASNTRWNHDTNGHGPLNVNQSFTKRMIVDKLHVNFNATFKPLITVNGLAQDARRRIFQIKNGKKPNNMFQEFSPMGENCIRICLDGLYNIIDADYQLLSPNLWFLYIDDFREGYARVEGPNGLMNFITAKGDLINHGQDWYIDADEFHNGYTLVQNNDGLWNILMKNGRYINDGKEWFVDIDVFSKGHFECQTVSGTMKTFDMTTIPLNKNKNVIEARIIGNIMKNITKNGYS